MARRSRPVASRTATSRTAGQGRHARSERTTLHPLERVKLDVGRAVTVLQTVDLADLGSWPPCHQVARALFPLEQLPARRHAVIRIGTVLPQQSMIDAVRLGHLVLHVEGPFPIADEWVALLRAATR